jgi:DNA-binding PadR family transcriptional regulator
MAEWQHSGFARYPLDNVALGLLMPGPRHGYRLYQEFEKNLGSIWKAGQTKFYVALSDLEAKGLLCATTEPQEGRPARKVYHLEEAGREVFLAWLRQPAKSMRAIRVEFMAKLRFFDLLNLEGAKQLIDTQIEVLQAMLDEWEAPTSEEPQTGGDTFYADIVQEFRRRQAIFMIEWLMHCRSRPWA